MPMLLAVSRSGVPGMPVPRYAAPRILGVSIVHGARKSASNAKQKVPWAKPPCETGLVVRWEVAALALGIYFASVGIRAAQATTVRATVMAEVTLDPAPLRGAQ